MNLKITPDLMQLLALVDERGASVCTGTCEHRKPNELHCHNIGYALKISSNGAKRRLQKLVSLGLMNRQRIDRADGKVMARYTVSDQGRKLL